MEIPKNVEMPIKCGACRCLSFMKNLTVRQLNNGKYLLKGHCIGCNGKYNISLDEIGYRELKIQIILEE